MAKLIVNADDFGMSEGVTLGILKAHVDGIVKSTTMMTNMPAAEFASSQMERFLELGVGLHLNLTAGKPILDNHRTIVDKEGNFLSNKAYDSNELIVDAEELYAEYEAQMEKFISLTGKLPTHIDHHHSYTLTNNQIPMMIKLAHKYDLPLRGGYYIEQEKYKFQKVDFSTSFYEEDANTSFFLDDKIDILKSDCVEIMSHPGFVDYYLYNNSSYNIQRANELNVLTSREVIDWVIDNKVELVNYTDIKKL